jgi:PAS domain S-box-containing protein
VERVDEVEGIVSLSKARKSYHVRYRDCAKGYPVNIKNTSPSSTGWGRVAFVAVACLCILLGIVIASNFSSVVDAFSSRIVVGLTILACSSVVFGYPTIALIRCKSRHAKIEAAFRESEARFRNLADALPQIVWTVGCDGNHATYLNRRWSEYTGLEAANMEVNVQVVHPDDLVAMGRHFAEAQRTGNVFEYEFRLRPGESGPYLWFLARGVPVRNLAGEIVEWFGTSTDIDDLKQTEEALRQSQRHFRELAESMPQLVWTDLPDGYCDYLGPQWVAYTGVPAAEHLGNGWVDQLHPEDRDSAYVAWNRAVADGTNFETKFRIRRADGVYRWFQTRAIPLRDEKGAIVKWFGTNTDIDDLKCAEGEIRRLNSELEMRVRELTSRWNGENAK